MEYEKIKKLGRFVTNLQLGIDRPEDEGDVLTVFLERERVLWPVINFYGVGPYSAEEIFDIFKETPKYFYIYDRVKALCEENKHQPLAKVILNMMEDVDG
jgi:hypothetical protein